MRSSFSFGDISPMTVDAPASSPPSEGGRPSWINASATMGINFDDNEAWLGEGEEVVAADTVVINHKAEPALRDLLRPMDWAARFVFTLDEFGTQSELFCCLGASAGAEGFTTSADTFIVCDFDGDYNDIAGLVVGQNVIAVSNNALGWQSSLNGGAVSTDGTFTGPLNDADFYFGVSGPALGDLFAGTIHLVEYFPLRTPLQLVALSGG